MCMGVGVDVGVGVGVCVHIIVARSNMIACWGMHHIRDTWSIAANTIVIYHAYHTYCMSCPLSQLSHPSNIEFTRMNLTNLVRHMRVVDACVFCV